MPRFRKKPIVIEAVHYDEHASRFGWGQAITDAHPWLEEAYDNEILDNIGHKAPDGKITDHHLRITTLEGTMRADPGDWIIRGVKGELYPCKPDIFEATYEIAE